MTPLRRTLTSNAVDATATRTFGSAMDIVVITAMGFTATQLGVMNALGAVSFLLLTVPVGTLVDRVGPLRVLALSLTVKALFTAVVVGAFLADAASFGLILTVVTLLGILTVASENAQLAMVPLITADRATVTGTVAKMTAADRVAAIVVPVLVGLVLERSSAGLPFSVALVLFVLALVPVLGLLRSATVRDSTEHRKDTEGASGAAGDGTEDVTSPAARRPGPGHGFRVLAANPMLLATVILVAAGNIGLAIGDSIVSLLVLRELDLGPGFFGVTGAVSAVAGLGSAVIAARAASRVSVRTAFAVGAVVQAGVAALPLLALAWTPGAVVLLLVHSICWSVIVSFTNIVGTSYLAETVDPGELGRAGGARRMVTMGSVPVAALGSGVLADALGLAAPLVVWPVLTLAAAVTFFLMTRGARGAGKDGGVGASS